MRRMLALLRGRRRALSRQAAVWPCAAGVVQLAKIAHAGSPCILSSFCFGQEQGRPLRRRTANEVVAVARIFVESCLQGSRDNSTTARAQQHIAVVPW